MKLERFMKKFDEKTKLALNYYVYALVDPETNRPFYIGMGKNDRVFDHVNDAKSMVFESSKLKQICEIQNKGYEVHHVILRHGLDAEQAYLIEASIIDYDEMFSGQLSNEVSGHKTELYGAMSVNEIKRRYNALPLKTIGAECVRININKRYDRAKGRNAIYEATRQKWRIADSRIGDPKDPKLKIVLSEYKGIVVEVFQVDNWFRVLDEKGKSRWGFNGHVADPIIREKYINRAGERSYGQPIRYHR